MLTQQEGLAFEELRFLIINKEENRDGNRSQA